MKFLTQGFTQGFFRNPDVRSTELRITEFVPPPREARHLCGPDYQDYSGYVDQPRFSAPEHTRERLLEESAELGRRIAQARCDAVNARSAPIAFPFQFGSDKNDK